MSNPRRIAVFPCQPILLSLLIAACETPVPGAWEEGEGYRSRALAPVSGRGSGFRAVPASRTNIDFVHTVPQDRWLENRHLAQGTGVALGDIDGDGTTDIVLARGVGPNAVYANRGGWRFEDVTERAGVAAADRHTTGLVLADVDGDADLDLLLTALGGPNALFVNDGTGAFVEDSAFPGRRSARGSKTMTLADIDADGDLDLYVTNYKVASALDLFPPEARAFDRVVRTVDGAPQVIPAFREHYEIEMIGGRAVRSERGEPDALYLNDGAGGFQPVSFTTGRFLDEDGEPLTENPAYFSLTARFYDLDEDGDPDLYVCNDFHHPDQIWLNDGDGTFRAAPRLMLRRTSTSTMAVDFSDIDRDGDLDFFEVDMLTDNPRRRKMQLPMHSVAPIVVGALDDRPQSPRNTLFLNRGDDTYAEIADYAGVSATDWTWGMQFLDVDLDGFEDVLVTTGHIRDVNDGDGSERIDRSPSIPWRQRSLEWPELPVANMALRNRGDLTFERMEDPWGFDQGDDISHGIASGDLDHDGDLDVIVTRLDDPLLVLRNDARAARIAIRLRGRPPNTAGVGAVVTVTGEGVPVQSKEITLGGMYLSSSEPLVTLAAGAAERLTVTVGWPDGTRSIIDDARPNRLYEIDRSSARPLPPTPVVERQTMFEDRSDELDHRHVETDIDDMLRQPLLPNRLNQLGPGVTWYDIDADGDEDLFVGSGSGGRLAYFRNDGARLVPGAPGPEVPFDLATILGVSNPDGSRSLLVGQSSYEAPNGQDALRVAGVRGVPWRGGGLGPGVDLVDGDTSSVGPMALADVDGDGDLDLFAGGRVIPSAYPLPATSRVYRNDRGRFVRDDTQDAFRSVGMVSSAVFSDLDGDADPDLLLAVEWGPIKTFENRDGRFVETDLGLRDRSSRWNGLATGDLNGDGRIDVVATSWGRNTPFSVAEHPLLLYYGDFDVNGRLDVIQAQFSERLGGVAPLERLSRLALFMPFVRRRTPTFAAFADATLDEVLGRPLDALPRLRATTMDHTVFLNRGGGFEAVPMPPEAQFAPAFHVGVADFDGDGTEDVFVSQNFFPNELGTPRYDAGRGLLMAGAGDGTLRPVPGHHSGITVYGDQRGAAWSDTDGDGRLDLVVSQNAAATTFYRNRTARVGVRVRLEGGPDNPDAIGAALRVIYPQRRGPLREIQSGSGYWSQHGATQVMGRGEDATGVWIRWPNGTETEVPLAPGQTELTVSMPRPSTF